MVIPTSLSFSCAFNASPKAMLVSNSTVAFSGTHEPIAKCLMLTGFSSLGSSEPLYFWRCSTLKFRVHELAGSGPNTIPSVQQVFQCHAKAPLPVDGFHASPVP